MILTWTCDLCGWNNDNNNDSCRHCGGQVEERLVRGMMPKIPVFDWPNWRSEITPQTEAMMKSQYIPRNRNQRLFKLIEEMGELHAALGKAGRWGVLSVNPELPVDQQETNGAWILREMADVEAAIAACRLDVEDEIAAARKP